MGGKSSKNSKNAAAAKQTPAVRSGTSRSAWEKTATKAAGISNGSRDRNGSKGRNGSNGRVVNKLRDSDDAWGQTTFNLLDIQAGRSNGGGDKFSNFHNITADRNEGDSERRRQEYNSKNSRSPPRRVSTTPSPTKSRKNNKGYNRSNSNSPRKAGRGRGGGFAKTNSAPERRHSDVSVISLDAGRRNNNARNRDPPRFSNSVPDGRAGGGNKGGGGGRRARSSSPARRKKSPPQQKNKGGGGGGRKGNVKGGFANLTNIKSASQSVDSNASNFNLNSRVDKFNDRRESLADARLARTKDLKNQFQDQRVTGSESYELAKRNMASDDWETEVKGVEMTVSIARQRPEILRGDIKHLIRLMIEELKNLRSQVCRAAGQAFGELYLHLGKAMETDLDKQVALLLQKAADTNKFIRESCNEALDAMCDNVSVYRAIQSVVDGGAKHKSVVVRANVARIVDNMVAALGPEKFAGCSKEFQELVIKQGASALQDGALDVRKHTKSTFSRLSRHAKFDSMLKSHLSEKDADAVRKAVK